MQLDAQEYLDLVENAGKIAFFDIEATGLRGDYNSVLTVSVKPYDQEPKTFSVVRPGVDEKVVREAGEYLEQFSCWVGYYSKGFDIPMLNTRRLRWRQLPIGKRLHLDMYFTLKANTLTSRRSQAHLLSWLGVEWEKRQDGWEYTQDMPQKMTVSAEMWNMVLAHPKKYLPVMEQRCESDCAGLEALYKRTRHIIREIKR